MKFLAYFFTVFFSSNVPDVLGSCGSEVQNKSVKSYDLNSVVFDGSISDCGCSSKSICVRKCCGQNYILRDNDTCVFDNSTRLVPWVVEHSKIMKIPPTRMHFVPGMLECMVSGRDVAVSPKPSYLSTVYPVLIDDGRLLTFDTNEMFDHHEYCLEQAEGIGVVAYVCHDRYVDDFNFSDRLSFVGSIISLPFLLVTFIVYALLPERNLHGMSLMCYVFALFMADFLTVFSFIYTGDVTFTGCRVIGMMTLYFFVASIFWMNVMSFDICSTFSGTRGFGENRKRMYRKRFSAYCAYAWGIPLLLVGLILTLSHTVRPHVWYDPAVRGVECFLKDGYPELLYFYGPLALLILANIVMFIVTAVKISKVQRDTAVLTKTGSNKHGSDDDKQTFQLYIRLLLAMGLNWSMEIINWAVNWQLPNVPPAVWYVTDAFNALYGVVIFFLFVFKKSIWRQLKKRYYQLRGKQPSIEPATAAGTSV